MNYLVTGGAGFIGSHLCDYLIKENNFVVAIDNLSLGKEKNIAHLMQNKNFKFIKTEICNMYELKKIFELCTFDAVFHLAANSDIATSREDPFIDLNNTFLTTFNVLNMMKLNNVKKIVFASTSAVYGQVNEKINENHGPLFPLSHYGASKLASEAFIASFVENYGIQAWITRFPNVIGSRATHGVIYDFVNKLKKTPDELIVLGDGEQEKSYLHVSDLIDALIYVFNNSSQKINYYNIGVETTTKVKEIAELILKQLNPDAKIKYTGGKIGWIGDVPKFAYNVDKIKKLGWKAKLSSTDAVKCAILEIIAELIVK